MKVFNVQNIVYKEGKHYVAQCLSVDVSSFGESETEALTNLKEALELYFEDTYNPVVSQVESPHVKTLTLESA